MQKGNGPRGLRSVPGSSAYSLSVERLSTLRKSLRPVVLRRVRGVAHRPQSKRSARIEASAQIVPAERNDHRCRARSFVLIPVFAVAFVSPAALAGQSATTLGTLKGWGVAVDPDRDCRIGLEGEKLTITVPSKRHDLSIEVGDVNAPRVLQEIKGDFIAQLKISGNVGHTGNRTSEHYLAYHGAGLLLWQDERTYIRLERASVVQDETRTVHYANFGLRQNGKLVDVERTGIRIADHDAYLRLERRGDRVFGSVSSDGVRWQSFDPYFVNLHAELKLGVVAINTSTEPFKAEFDEFEVFVKKNARSATSF